MELGRSHLRAGGRGRCGANIGGGARAEGILWVLGLEWILVRFSKAGLTDTASWWAIRQVGKKGRTVSEAAQGLGYVWHTVKTPFWPTGVAGLTDT